MNRKIAFIIIILLTTLNINPLYAQDKPRIAIEIVDNSNDPVGKNLVHHVTNKIRQSNSLRITTTKEPRIGIVILTLKPKSEYLASETIYSIIWLSYHRAERGFLPPLYLHNKIGLCNEGQINLVAEKVIEDTNKVIGELFKSLRGRGR